MSLIKQCKEAFATQKAKVSMLSIALFAAIATSAFAAEGGTEDYSKGVIDQFMSIVKTGSIIILAIGGAAIAIFGIFMGYKYGRKAVSSIGK
ncbi:hypothetical protein ABEV00_28420 [Paenibacillus thiaminolyticus]|uniref:hypothetical protein n=1 Tax=Paenibacillus thiaminolyticus TaxID=49283 RepID=UPI003D2E8779